VGSKPVGILLGSWVGILNTYLMVLKRDGYEMAAFIFFS